MNPAVLLTAISFTLPSFNADTTHGGRCEPGTIPLVDLDSLYAVFTPRWGRADTVLRRSVRGLEGQRLTVDIPRTDFGTVYVLTRDISGNVSCNSNLVGINAPSVSVPDATAATGDTSWYDVAGRRMHG